MTNDLHQLLRICSEMVCVCTCRSMPVGGLYVIKMYSFKNILFFHALPLQLCFVAIIFLPFLHEYPSKLHYSLTYA